MLVHRWLLVGVKYCLHWAIVDPTNWAIVGPISKITLAQQRLATLAQHNGFCWANVGPIQTCYLGNSIKQHYLKILFTVTIGRDGPPTKLKHLDIQIVNTSPLTDFFTYPLFSSSSIIFWTYKYKSSMSCASVWFDNLAKVIFSPEQTSYAVCQVVFGQCTWYRHFGSLAKKKNIYPFSKFQKVSIQT